MSRKNIIRVLVFLGIIALVILAFNNREIVDDLHHPRKIKNYVLSFGLLSPVIFIGLYSVRTLLIGFPISIFAILSYTLFGMVPGFIYSMIGVYLSATIAFFIGRYIARDTVSRYLAERVKFFNKDQRKHFKLILYLRLIMVMPFDIFSYAVGGLTKIRYKDFIAGTMLGIIPEFLGYGYLVHIGSRADISTREKIFYSGLVILVLFVMHLLNELVQKIRTKKSKGKG